MIAGNVYTLNYCGYKVMQTDVPATKGLQDVAYQWVRHKE